MMKLCGRVLLCILGSALALFSNDNARTAGIADFRDLHWNLFYLPDMPDGCSERVEDEKKLILPDGRSVPGRPVSFSPEGMLDLRRVIQPVPPVLGKAVLVATFQASRRGKAVLGAGADWTMYIRCNGKVVGDTRKTGNNEQHIRPDNYLMEFEYQAGKNLLTMEVASGSVSFLVAAKVSPLQPPPSVVHGPWATFPDGSTGGITLIFESDFPCPAGVAYRGTGEEEWRRAYDDIGGQIRRDSAVHRVRLSGLQPGKKYEYRIVFLEPQRQFAEIQLPQSHYFVAPDAQKENFHFLVMGDLQFPPEILHPLLEKNLRMPDAQSADFHVFLGDMSWNSNFAIDYLESLVEPHRKLTKEKPLVSVRGNHETYGRDANVYFDYLAAPALMGNEGYYMFRVGRVCFFVLDCGDDAPRCPWPSTRFLHDFDSYFDQQAQWLLRAVDSPEAVGAKYRIVLAHGIPIGDDREYMAGRIRKMIDPLFAGKNPHCRIHLWLGGHVHYPLRSIPFKNEMLSGYPGTQKICSSAGQRYGFPVITVSGPRPGNPPERVFTTNLVQIREDGIHVECRDANGIVFDQCVIREDGTVEDGESALFLRRLPYGDIARP